MVDHLSHRIEHFWDGVLDQRHDEVALRVSALLLVLYPPDGDYFALVALIFAIPMLLDGGMARSKWLWAFMALDCLASTWVHRHSQDNHKYLLLYWTLACSLAVWSDQAERVLVRNGRLLVALVFTFAVSWKLLGGEVLSGEFFEWELLVDQRFAAFAGLFGDLAPSTAGLNRSGLDLLRALPSEGLTMELGTAPGVARAALLLGWSMTLLEAVLALSFWGALLRRWSDLQDWILIVFCLGTYTLTPIAGFGTILAVMGFAQAPSDRRELREAYLWTLIFVQFARMPTFQIIQRLTA